MPPFPPKDGEPHDKVVKGKTFHWCIYHQFWTPTHTFEQCRKGQKERENKNATGPKLALNVAAHGIFADNASISYASHDLFNETLDQTIKAPVNI